MPNTFLASRRRVRLAILAAAALAPLGAASAASAATLTANADGTVNYAAASGKVNSLTITQSGTSATFTRVTAGPFSDNDPITATGCSENTPGVSYTCPATAITVALGDQQDRTDASGLTTIPITIYGGTEDDSLLEGGGGNDTIDGGPGNDGNNNFGFGPEGLIGNGGNDTITGGTGNDVNIDGGAGDDNIDGGAGNDTIFDSGAQDTAATPTFTSNDTINGGDGNDTIDAGPGNDTVNGGAGDDPSLRGGDGADTVNGNEGDDTIVADAPVPGESFPTNDNYNGGTGSDTVDYSNYSNDINVTLDGTANDGVSGENDNVGVDVEGVTGGAGNDTLTGNATANDLEGGAGNDTLSGAAGDDTLGGGDGNDTLGGGDGRDQLNGGAGADTLNGDTGDDDLNGGSGDDVFNGGDGIDTADYSGSFSNITASLDGKANDGAPGEADNIDADGKVENVITGFGNDTVAGNALANFIDTGYGNDVIFANDGTFLTDIVSCGPGYDTAAGDPLDSLEATGPNRCENVPAATVTRTPSSTSATVNPKRDKTAPYKFTTSGKVTIGNVPTSLGCGSTAFVIVQVKAGQATISARRVKLSSTCKFKSTVTLHFKKRFFGHKKLRFQAKFSGNKYLLPSQSAVKHVQVG